MKKGGIIADGAIITSWHPQEQFEKTGLKSLWYTGGKPIGKRNLLLKNIKIPNAWYCENCNKVVGIFDVIEQYD